MTPQRPEHVRPRAAPAGQGLLELIIAVGVIASSVVATLALILTTLHLAEVSKGQILAANLAREGIEIVRAVRDGNWLGHDAGLAGVEWNTNLGTDADGDGIVDDYTVVMQFIPPSDPFVPDPSLRGQWQLNYTAGQLDFANRTSQSPTMIYLDTQTKLYTQWPDGRTRPSSLAPTRYWRLVTLWPICWDLAAADAAATEQTVRTEGTDCSQFHNADSVPFTWVGVEVRSEVTWETNGPARSILLIDKLFNWKP